MAVRKVSIVLDNMAFRRRTPLCSEAEPVPEHRRRGAATVRAATG
jgi:hypothetical protein